MILHHIFTCCFSIEEEVFTTEYFFTKDVAGQPLGRGRVWMAVRIHGIEGGSFHIDKPATIMLQPREVIEKIVEREAVGFIRRLILSGAAEEAAASR